MKMMGKNILIRGTAAAVWLLALCPYIRAEEEAIELPDVTTVVSGGAITAGKDAVPDYAGGFNSDESSRSMLPSVADNSRGITAAPVQEPEKPVLQKEKLLSVEGEVGGGYPFLFLGKFDLHHSGDSPFTLTFSHYSNEGYADKKAADGFFDRSTQVGLKKDFVFDSSSHSITASYQTADDGLQSLSSVFFDVVRHAVSAGEQSKFLFGDGKNYSIRFGAGGNWYNRYGGEKNAAPLTFADEAQKRL